MKERIVGAVVLVTVVILVVPVFLDGPPGNGEVVSERVPLPGQSDQEIKTQVLDLDRTEPMPVSAAQTQAVPIAAQSEPASAPSETEVQEQAKPEPKPEPEPVVTPVVDTAVEKKTPEEKPPEKRTELPVVSSSSTGMWAVQLGSFASQENAERLAAGLRKQGFAAFLSQLSTSAGRLHRVRIGPQKDRESAEAMAERLAKAGHTGKVLPHP